MTAEKVKEVKQQIFNLLATGINILESKDLEGKTNEELEDIFNEILKAIILSGAEKAVELTPNKIDDTMLKLLKACF